MFKKNPVEPQIADYLEDFSNKLDCVIFELASVRQVTLGHNQKFYSVAQLAKKLGMAPGTIYNKISKGQIPFIKIGGSVRFTDEQINQITNEKIR